MKPLTLRIFFLVFCLFAMMCATSHAAVTATVDRTSIALDETLNLVISKDSSSFFSGPDLSAVEKDFNIRGQKQSSSTQIVNGSVTSSVTWNIVLAPKRIGTLQIPSIAVGKEKTRPMTVKVVKQAELKTKATDASMFIETDVDARSVYVQSQVIYTLRIYAVSGTQVQDPGVPQLQDAVVEKLDNTSFEKRIDGQLYRVFELKYAVFPQKSGILEIPQIVVHASLPGQQRYNNFFGSQGKKVKLRSKSEKVTVREKPDSYPHSAIWLPTNSLSIADEWSHNPRNLKVGESATITIGMAGEGLLGTQLPPVEIAEIDGVKLYQGKAEVQNHPTSDGITGVRQEAIALIPTKPGTLQLPEIRIPWWDKLTSKVEYAVIPARELMITGEVEKTSQAGTASSIPVTPSASPQVNAPESTNQYTPVIWIAACSVFAVLWLATLLLLVRTRRQMSFLASGGILKDKGILELKEGEAFKILQNSCQSNDPLAARTAVINWAKVVWPEEKVHSLADLERLLAEQEVAPVFKDIDNHLYGQSGNGDTWQGNLLLEKVKEIRKNSKKGMQGSEILEPLYK